jgi:H2-forming N5,N10-methylenetetrahydromethanopterin dehydrogenase-like enzyme
MIFAKSKVIIEVIFNELIDTNSKYNFITLLTSKVNTFEDKIKLITLYETNAQMSSQLVSDIEDLTQLYEMYSICNKKTTKNKIIKRMERLVEISDVLTLEDAKLIEKIGNDVLITKEDKDLLIKGISNKSPQEQRAEL